MGETIFKIKPDVPIDRPPGSRVPTPANASGPLAARGPRANPQSLSQPPDRQTAQSPDAPGLQAAEEQRPNLPGPDRSAESTGPDLHRNVIEELNVEPDKDAVEDYWHNQGYYWIRHHILPRRLTFVPEDSPGGPPVARLAPKRITFYKIKDSTVEKTRSDRWQEDGQVQPHRDAEAVSYTHLRAHET